MSKAIYPGTFDPITNGHFDLIVRATRIFDEIVVAIAANPDKNPLFSVPERITMVRQVCDGLENVEVIGFDGLLIHLVEEQGAHVVLRGLRAVSDFEFEFQLASANRRLSPDIETVFLTPSENHTFTAASLVKEIATFGGDVSSFLDPRINRILADKLEQTRAERDSS
jgi:pantetheine-phosphate adenylyltransferase